jgi:hypothetical protein
MVSFLIETGIKVRYISAEIFPYNEATGIYHRR